jgi:hypothetical protein
VNHERQKEAGPNGGCLKADPAYGKGIGDALWGLH